ncbi:MAG: hypothetical protein ACHQ4F_10855 [Candidatus Dormibacteria bacterium]
MTVDYAQIVLVHVCVCASAALGWVGGQGIGLMAERTSGARRIPHDVAE